MERFSASLPRRVSTVFSVAFRRKGVWKAGVDETCLNLYASCCPVLQSPGVKKTGGLVSGRRRLAGGCSFAVVCLVEPFRVGVEGVETEGGAEVNCLPVVFGKVVVFRSAGQLPPADGNQGRRFLRHGSDQLCDEDFEGTQADFSKRLVILAAPGG